MCVCGHKGVNHDRNGAGKYWCLDYTVTNNLPSRYSSIYCGCIDFEFAPGQTFEAIPWVEINVTKPKKLKVTRCKCGHKWNAHTGDNLECAQRKNSPGNERMSVELCDCNQFRSEVLSHG